MSSWCYFDTELKHGFTRKVLSTVEMKVTFNVSVAAGPIGRFQCYNELTPDFRDPETVLLDTFMYAHIISLGKIVI